MNSDTGHSSFAIPGAYLDHVKTDFSAADE
jgi:hypothetical protein